MFRSNKIKDRLVTEEETLTFLARGFEFKGSLNFDGTVRIDGSVTGEIRTKGTLIVGEHAIVEGDVSARAVLSGGKINGNIIATEKVRLISTAALLGTVTAPLLEIEEGVRLRGNCETAGWQTKDGEAGLSPSRSATRMRRTAKV
jgi:cytoskeletal protein CcmA (bactofilin family)